MIARLRHVWLALRTLPRLIFNARQRALLRDMRRFSHSLPVRLRAPLPAALQALTPATTHNSYHEQTVRDLADLSVLLDRRSPLGLCLRRSLTRYHYLRQNNVPVVLQFGAKLTEGKPDRDISGHAWLTLDGKIYYETNENWQGFAVMFTWPRNE